MPRGKKAPAKQTTQEPVTPIATKVDLKDKPVRRVGRPPRVSTEVKRLTVVVNTEKIELSFSDESEYSRSIKRLAYNVKSGQPVEIESGGKTYTFCRIDYLIR